MLIGRENYVTLITTLLGASVAGLADSYYRLETTLKL